MMMGRGRQAFTMLELVAVLLIMSVIAGAVTWSLQPAYGASQWRDAAEKLAYFDRLTRHAAVRSDHPMRMIIDLNEQRVTREVIADDDSQARDAFTHQMIRLPRGVSIAQVWLGDERVAFGSAEIHCSAKGQTPSYGLLIEDADGNRHVQVVAGVTGQIVAVQEEWQVDELFAQLSSGSDTD